MLKKDVRFYTFNGNESLYHSTGDELLKIVTQKGITVIFKCHTDNYVYMSFTDTNDITTIELM